MPMHNTGPRTCKEIVAAQDPTEMARGVPRTYRDQKDLALLAAQILKSRNPNSAVKVKDLKTGEETVIAYKAVQQ